MIEPAYEARRQSWERQAGWPLTLLAVVFLAAYAWPILDPGVSALTADVLRLVTWTVWLVFVVDYVVRFALSLDRGRFVRGNVLDLAVIVLPLLRPLRLVRLVRVLSVLNRHAGGSLRGRVAVYVVGSSALVLFVAALAVLDAERGHEGANISTFADALWWAVTTVTTVGYGDQFPVTGGGRLVAGGLMLTGIALLGVVTASFASWLIEKVSHAEEQAQAATRQDIAELSAQITELRAELDRDRS